MDENASKWSSRKFLLTMLQWVAIIGVPVLYAKVGISENIIITVLASSSAVVSAYIAGNVMQKKIDAA